MFSEDVGEVIKFRGLAFQWCNLIQHVRTVFMEGGSGWTFDPFKIVRFGNLAIVKERTRLGARLSCQHWRKREVREIEKGWVWIRRDVRSGRTTLSLERKSKEAIPVPARLRDVRGCLLRSRSSNSLLSARDSFRSLHIISMKGEGTTLLRLQN